MKVLNLVLMLLVVGTSTLFASSKTEKFKVYGNCGMCESRIEKAALSIEGVTKADWNKETKMIEVSFDNSKTDIHKIHMAIAKVGHDTELQKANDEAYGKLHGCCKYERKKSSSTKQKTSGCTGSKTSAKKSGCCKGK